MSMETTGDVTMLMLAGPQFNKNAPPDPRCPCDKWYRKNAKK